MTTRLKPTAKPAPAIAPAGVSCPDPFAPVRDPRLAAVIAQRDAALTERDTALVQLVNCRKILRNHIGATLARGLTRALDASKPATSPASDPQPVAPSPEDIADDWYSVRCECDRLADSLRCHTERMADGPAYRVRPARGVSLWDLPAAAQCVCGHYSADELPGLASRLQDLDAVLVLPDAPSQPSNVLPLRSPQGAAA
jgi:hypothetical protein